MNFALGLCSGLLFGVFFGDFCVLFCFFLFLVVVFKKGVVTKWSMLLKFLLF